MFCVLSNSTVSLWCGIAYVYIFCIYIVFNVFSNLKNEINEKYTEFLAEAVRFLGQKNPQHAFLWRRSEAVGPMS